MEIDKKKYSILQQGNSVKNDEVKQNMIMNRKDEYNKDTSNPME